MVVKGVKGGEGVGHGGQDCSGVRIAVSVEAGVRVSVSVRVGEARVGAKSWAIGRGARGAAGGAAVGGARTRPVVGAARAGGGKAEGAGLGGSCRGRQSRGAGGGGEVVGGGGGEVHSGGEVVEGVEGSEGVGDGGQCNGDATIGARVGVGVGLRAGGGSVVAGVQSGGPLGGCYGGVSVVVVWVAGLRGRPGRRRSAGAVRAAVESAGNGRGRKGRSSVPGSGGRRSGKAHYFLRGGPHGYARGGRRCRGGRVSCCKNRVLRATATSRDRPRRRVCCRCRQSHCRHRLCRDCRQRGRRCGRCCCRYCRCHRRHCRCCSRARRVGRSGKSHCLGRGKRWGGGRCVS